MNLTAVILNHLPFELLGPTLASVSFADNILIVHDSSVKRSFTEPSTVKGKCRLLFRRLDDFSSQRNYALSKAKTDWILFVDSDEIVSKKLATEIRTAIKATEFSGYTLKRQDNIAGINLNHGETKTIKLLRLAQKNAGRFTRFVHEKWEIRGRVGELKYPLLHIKKNLTKDFIDRIVLYGPQDSSSLLKEKKQFSYFSLFFKPTAKFILNYVVRRGLLDGTLGLFHAYVMSLQSLSVRVFQWQANHLSAKTDKL